MFVEKPLCLTLDELAEIEAAAHTPIVMLGFNRRFAPQVQKVKELLAGVQGPKSFVMTVNAGAIPATTGHKMQRRRWRIIGEGVTIDLLRYLCGLELPANT